MEVDGYGNFFFGDDANVLPSAYYLLLVPTTYYLVLTTSSATMPTCYLVLLRYLVLTTT